MTKVTCFDRWKMDISISKIYTNKQNIKEQDSRSVFTQHQWNIIIHDLLKSKINININVMQQMGISEIPLNEISSSTNLTSNKCSFRRNYVIQKYILRAE
jgi:hypothetical protein